MWNPDWQEYEDCPRESHYQWDGHAIPRYVVKVDGWFA